MSVGRLFALALGGAVLVAVLVDDTLRSRGVGHTLALAVAVLGGAMIGGLVGAPRWLSLRARMRRLARATRALAQGDFDAPLPAPDHDDLGELQRVWKRMRLAMEEQVDGLRGEVGRQRSILDGMAEGVALLLDGEIIAANPAFGDLIGASDRLEGKTPLEAARVPELAELIDESIARDAQVVREIYAEPRMLRVAARPLGGPQRQTVVVLFDMTEARRLERLRRDFVANASHELRTPVAAILGAAETLAAGAADDEHARASFVDILVRHAQRLSRLTKDLLDLARLEAGYRARPEIVSVPSVVDAVLLPLRPRAEEKRIALTTTLAPDVGALEAEGAAVEQILTNLVDNAIKYTPAGGTIELSVRAVDTRAEITVADTGPGISAEHLPRLFERFYRVDDARSRELGGTGLGLSIVRHLVAANGGEIRVDSVVGRGTRFVVLFARPGTDPKSLQESHSAPPRDR